MGTTPTKGGNAHEVADSAIERLFEGAADPAESQPTPAPADATGVTQEDSDA